MTLKLYGDGAIGPLSATEVGYLDGVTSAVQTQINGKVGVSESGAGFVRFTDGTQIVAMSVVGFGALEGALDEVTVTFTRAFLTGTAPFVVVSDVEPLTTVLAAYKVKAANATTCTIRGLFASPFGRANYTSANIIAFGRWA
jgi:hypothetical protein